MAGSVVITPAALTGGTGYSAGIWTADPAAGGLAGDSSNIPPGGMVGISSGQLIRMPA